jgi:hypothetical protein
MPGRAGQQSSRGGALSIILFTGVRVFIHHFLKIFLVVDWGK